MPRFLKNIGVLAVVAIILHPYSGYCDGYSARLKDLADRYYLGEGVPIDRTKALLLYLQAAGRGDAEAKYIAGGMYYKGYGTPRNPVKAFSLLYEAALAGSSTPMSHRIIGQYFLTGTGIPQNYTKALKWYRFAAEGGDRESQSELAFLYYTGRGGEKDLGKAFHWYEKSAMQGLAVAQYSLGIMYLSGTGGEGMDLIKAYSWTSLAASQNHLDGRIARDYIEGLLSAEELAQAQDLSFELFQQINNH